MTFIVILVVALLALLPILVRQQRAYVGQQRQRKHVVETHQGGGGTTIVRNLLWRRRSWKARIGVGIGILAVVIAATSGGDKRGSITPKSEASSAAVNSAKSPVATIPRGKWLTNAEATQLYQLGGDGLDQMGDPVKLGNKSVRCEGVGTRRGAGRYQYFMCGDYDSLSGNALTYYSTARLRAADR